MKKKITSIVIALFMAMTAVAAPVSANETASSKTVTINGAKYNKTKTTLLEVPDGTKGTFKIAGGTKVIAKGAFYRCDKITSVYIPKSVKKIQDSAFMFNDSLKKFTVNKSNPYFCAYKGVLYNKKKTVLIKYPDAKGNSYTTPKTVKTINSYAITAIRYEKEPLNVYLSKNVTTLKPWAIYMKDGPTTSVPKNVKKIGEGNFFGTVTYCTKGSTAEKYLKKNELAYATSLDGELALKTTAQGKQKIKISYKPVYSKYADEWDINYDMDHTTGYQIYMKEPGSSKYKLAKTTSKTTCTFKGLKKGKTYQFKVRPYRNMGDSKIYGTFTKAKKVKAK